MKNETRNSANVFLTESVMGKKMSSKSDEIEQAKYIETLGRL